MKAYSSIIAYASREVCSARNFSMKLVFTSIINYAYSVTNKDFNSYSVINKDFNYIVNYAYSVINKDFNYIVNYGYSVIIEYHKVTDIEAKGDTVLLLDSNSPSILLSH